MRMWHMGPFTRTLCICSLGVVGRVVVVAVVRDGMVVVFVVGSGMVVVALVMFTQNLN